MDTISRITFRRFLLGQQGLWPGRRFKGLAGTTSAIQQMEGIQLDPLNIVARSQKIALFGRVLDFKLEHLYHAAYENRSFFDYGGWLFMYPMSEFPYWLAHETPQRAGHLLSRSVSTTARKTIKFSIE